MRRSPLNTGYLVREVLDIVENGMPIAILDTSAACHMPDVLEMPYRPEIIGAGKPGERAWTCRLGGPTCLAGDVIGDYSFDHPLQPGDRLVFTDMAHYTMVKNNTFNGIGLPAIALCSGDEQICALSASSAMRTSSIAWDEPINVKSIITFLLQREGDYIPFFGYSKCLESALSKGLESLKKRKAERCSFHGRVFRHAPDLQEIAQGQKQTSPADSGR